MVLAEHLLTPSLDPLRHEVSEYVHGSGGTAMTLGFASWALSLLATGLLVRHRRASPPLAILFLVAALGILLVTLFRTETSAGALPPGAELTTTGKLHDVGSGLATLALLGTAVTVGLGAAFDTTLRASAATLVLASLGVDGVLLLVGTSVGGLRQRILLLIGCSWQFLVLRSLGARLGRRSKTTGSIDP